MTISHVRRTTTVLTLAVTTLGGGALIAGGASSASAGTGHHRHHGHHHLRDATSLGIHVGRHAIGSGDSDRIVGRLTTRHHGDPGRRVVLQSRPPKTTTWTTVTSGTTHVRGRVGFTVTPTATTRYRLVFRGGPALRPTHSRGRTVVVRDMRLTATATPGSIDAGQTASVSGVLSDKGTPTVGATIDLLAKPVGTHHGFSAAGTAVTGTDGSVAFPVTPTTTTRYRLVEPAASAAAAATAASRVVTVAVRTPSSLSIRGRAAHSSEVITGDLRGSGHGLPGRKVTVQSRPAGGATWTAVKTKRTARRGTIRFHLATPTASTDYRLVFAGGRGHDATASGVVTVNEA
jgi:5-hydroxyisourate hydrolase-like protein (transthyretin family)